MHHILNHKKPRLVPIALGVALVLAFVTGALGRPAAVHAANFTVVDGEVLVSDNGLCSLREAIINANADALIHDDCVHAGAGADTITLPPAGTFTLTDSFAAYSGATGLPQVTSTIIIEGDSSTIDRSGGNVFRLFAVSNTGNLTLNDLALTDGAMTSDVGGGAIYNNGGTVTINDSSLSGHDGSGSSGGGAITSNGGTITVNRSTFTSNLANSGPGGGAIYGNNAATVNITDSTFTLNTSTGNVGGAINAGYTGANNFTILRSTIYNNSANGGGGIFLGSGSLTITNSTVSGNISGGAGGGGLFNNSGSMTLNNTTVTGNQTSNQGGGVLSNGGTLNLNRSIISGNTSNTGYDSGYEVVSYGTENANNYNVFGRDGISNNRAFAYSLAPGANDFNATDDGGNIAIGSILNTTLAANGGPTNTHALVAGSPAVDRAPSAACTAAPIDNVDQRGYPRNVDGNAAASANECDAGAFEYLSTPPPTTGDIRIVKEADPEGDTAFSFTEDIESLGFSLTDDGVTDNFIDFTSVTPGSYTVSEDGETGWTLDDITCDDADSSGVPATGVATINLDAGETVTCTFSNSRDTGTVTISKRAFPADDTEFHFTHDLDATGAFTLKDPSDNTSQTFVVPTGEYKVTETLDPGWSFVSITCLGDLDIDHDVDFDTGELTLGVDKDEQIYCEFANDRNEGTIIIKKSASPEDDTLFGFTHNIDLSGPFDLQDPSDDTKTFNDVPLGTYTVTEDLVPGWAVDTISCNDNNSTGNPAMRQATVELDSRNEIVTCTFSNIPGAPPAVEAFLSATTAGKTSDDVSFGSEDILFYDGSAWSVWFDGSLDAGLNPVKTYHNIDAFWIPDPSGDEVIVSFTRNQRPVPGINGIIDGMDLVRWDGSALTLLFDGQDVGLENLTGENVDAVHVLPGSEWPGTPASCLHYLLISTKGAGKVPADGGGTLKFSGEDVLGFCLTQAGADTAGLWTMVLDGSTVGMNKNSTESISLSDDGQTLYLTTTAKFTVNGVLLGNRSMVYTYDVGTQTFSGPIFIAPAEGLPKVVDGLQVN